MRICSLLPSATEIVYALGLGEHLVGVSHRCDFPDDAKTKPVVASSIRDISHLTSLEIDTIIQQARINGNPLYWINGDLLRELRPDLIITQELCEVCAIGSGSVFETASKVLDYSPNIITIRPAGLDDIFQNILNIAMAAQAPSRGEALVNELKQRVHRVTSGVADVQQRPKVLCLDWLDPFRNTGQWGPELVELAGGSEGLAVKRGVSRELDWDEVLAYQPEYLMVMPCAFEPVRVREELAQRLTGLPGWESLPAVARDQVFLFDGRVPSRHGPRVIDVMEGLAEAIYPQRFIGLTAAGIFEKAKLAGGGAVHRD